MLPQRVLPRHFLIRGERNASTILPFLSVDLARSLVLCIFMNVTSSLTKLSNLFNNGELKTKLPF